MMIDFTLGHLIEQTRKKNANPGGGALVSLIANLGINLLFMMDKKKYEDPDLEKEAVKIRAKLLKISKRLEEVMQEDIDRVNSLIDAYKSGQSKKVIEEKTLAAIGPPRETIDLSFEAMDLAGFILKNGKMDTISDGEIGIRLIKEAVFSSIINIEINQKQIDYDFDKDTIVEKCEKLFEKNLEIIKGRNK